ncbi:MULTISPECIES: tetratricopeptide repeat protein [Cyanophyceae]|uniref:Tetratricopeptide repeat protein n=1 Tax=Leptolyngbya subtilissima DQ-A4 TaxID=2933933 RepID=A0ABV0KAX0_9CYAN|nr:tetratricopeptide repeat protein [Nodosilinea sp. FACHB-141]MBD2113717.1 tetratricopeptide repeat protein [Nodosilinea sp. FACHB-141]
MLLPSLRFTKPLLLLIILPLALLTPVAVPLTRAQENRIEIAPIHPSSIRDPDILLDREAQRLLSQGINQHDAGLHQAALQSFQAALEVFRQNGDRDDEAYALNSQGLVYYDLGQDQQAVKYFQQALAIYQSLDDSYYAGNVQTTLGQAYIFWDQPQQAIEYLQPALSNYRAIRYPEGEAFVSHHLGFAYNSLGQPQQAIEYYQQALPILQAERGVEALQTTLTVEVFEAATLANMAEALIAQNQTDLAINYFEQSAEVYKPIREQLSEPWFQQYSTEFIINTYHRCAEMLRQQNRPQEAQQVLDFIKEVE